MKYISETTVKIGNKMDRRKSNSKISNTKRIMNKDIKVLFPSPQHHQQQEETCEQYRRQSMTKTSGLTRKTICNWMKTTLNRYCTLSTSGICAFRYNGAVVVVEVPPNNAINGTFFLYSIVCKDICQATKYEGDLHGHEERLIMRKALELNHMQQETKGGCLSLDGDELTLCFCGDIQQCNTAEMFATVVSNFVMTVSDLRMDIALVRSRVKRERDSKQQQSKSKDSTSSQKKRTKSRSSTTNSLSSELSSSPLSRDLSSAKNETESKKKRRTSKSGKKHHDKNHKKSTRKEKHSKRENRLRRSSETTTGGEEILPPVRRLTKVMPQQAGQ